MTEKWRLLKTGYNNAFTNMAIDRAVMLSHSKEFVPPTVRFYGWNPPAISIGYFPYFFAAITIALKFSGFT